MALAALTDRWSGLAAGVLVESVSGSSYAFGVYSVGLQGALNLTIAELNTVASASNVGYYTNFFAGLAFDAVGPLWTGLAGAAMSAGGYALFAAFAAKQLPLSVGGLAFATFLWGHGAGYADTAALATSVTNFPHNRGLVVGLLRAAFGLSAAILSLCYASFYRPDVPGFLRFLAVAVPAVAATGVLAMRLVPDGAGAAAMSPAEARRVLTVGYGLAVALGAYLLAVAVAQDEGAVRPQPALAAALAPLLLGQLLLTAPWRACSGRGGGGRAGGAAGGGRASASPADDDEKGVQLQTTPLLVRTASNLKPGAGAAGGEGTPRRPMPPGGSLTDNVLSFDFALIFTVFLTVTGSGSE